MGLRDDMAKACSANKGTEGCSGKLEITDAYREEVNGDMQELLMLATLGCRSGCRCMKASARIENHDGVEWVVARCNADPRLLFTDHGR